MKLARTGKKQVCIEGIFLLFISVSLLACSISDLRFLQSSIKSALKSGSLNELNAEINDSHSSLLTCTRPALKRLSLREGHDKRSVLSSTAASFDSAVDLPANEGRLSLLSSAVIFYRFLSFGLIRDRAPPHIA
jgi:hypothetical protein